ncbi:hypothetical protein CHIBA101_2063 [Actinomyces sp. Chiba101]|uniref:hypothetical protein n=1 Tax=Actinomyces TaxID=1654 RepID=UPI000974EFAC|nr:MULTISPECIES: hypothetical protein [Actinomyces]BAW93892.1 hypothetical protein CHIBA101_2063 [Actinomyces sp. Chiba101]
MSQGKLVVLSNNDDDCFLSREYGAVDPGSGRVTLTFTNRILKSSMITVPHRPPRRGDSRGSGSSPSRCASRVRSI